MSEQPRLNFEQCATLSGLLSAEQLSELAEAVRARSGGELPEDPRVRGELLGEEAVARGWLNPWQVKQLLEGRTKFTLGAYRVVDGLGRGGGGQVFKGVHELLGREVALKVLPRDRATPERIERFLREIRTLAALDHPNLVRALDAGWDGGVYYLVLEYVPGLDLRRFVQASGPLGENQAATIIAQIALALDYAHRRGLVHRDVKPGNVLVTPEGWAKLSDLGFASSLFGEELLQTRQVKIAGTVDYLAPDHIQAPWDPKPAWDIYSLGCTLYYAVTGRVPYPEGTTEEKLRAHLEKQPRDPQELNPRLSREFIDIIQEMMAKDPQDRLASAHEVLLRLGPWVDPSVLPGEYAVVIYEQHRRRTSTPSEVAPPPVAPQKVHSGSVLTATSSQEVTTWSSSGEPAPVPAQSEIGVKQREIRPTATPVALPSPHRNFEVSTIRQTSSQQAPVFAVLLFVVLPLVLMVFTLAVSRLLR